MTSEDIAEREKDTLLLRLQREKYVNLKPPPSPILYSKRFIVSVLLFFGHVMIAMGSQVIHIAAVEMTSKNDHTNQSSTNDSTFLKLLFEPTVYQWDTITIGAVQSMFWYGCSFSPIGGVLSQKFGGATIMGVTMMMVAGALLLTPLGLRIHFYLFLGLRILVGVLEGFSTTSCAPIFAHWIPKQERSILVSSIVNGFYFGNAFTFILCGFLAHRWGWPMSFYGAGIICFCWSLLWLLIVTNDPAEDRTISQKELAYIKNTTESICPAAKKDHPYKEILLSPPFWALTLCYFAYSWATAFVVGYCPMYIKDVTQNSTNVVGYLSSIPNIANMFIIPISGILLNKTQKTIKLRDNQIHKITVSGGFAISAVLFALIPLANDFNVSMICAVIINVLVSVNRVVFELIKVSMAPNHSSLISGMSLIGQSSGAVIAQMFVGYMVQNHSIAEWNTCFFWSTGVLVLTASFYLISGSSEPQSWSMLSQSQETYQEDKARGANQ
ncbi:vesicular glutamate transporter 3-like [Planococcus citri]|uniref:vesicular glutamate transporter 3-like n=1 Tax=Planococcus citri TaxID=170843 RepID=UPI0031F867A9